MKKVLLVIIFCLLMSDIASAQCAWVLWESNSDDGYLRWQVNDAFPSYEKCKQGQRIECERWKEMLLKNIKKTPIERVADRCPDTLTIFHKDSSHPREIVYKCFPDTIDPRK